MKLKHPFEITGIGSMPHQSEREACNIVFTDFRRIPFWPQLVNKSFLEDMMAQFSERIPGIGVDLKKKRVFVDRHRGLKKDIEELNDHCQSGDLEYFSFSEDYAAGFYEYIYRLKNHDNKTIDYLKGQITGPVSFVFTVSDEDDIPIYFDKEICQAAVKTLSFRAKWQAARLKDIHKDVIIFIDEPSLVFFKERPSGSKIKKEDLAAYINSVAAAIHTESCFAGLHCCADADWDFVLSTDIDIISFDAFNYGESFVKNTAEIEKYLERGGIIAWGIVPTAPAALNEDAGEIVMMLEKYIKSLAGKAIDIKKIINASLITPSCGCGTLSRHDAEKVTALCVKLSRLARERIAV